MQNENDPFQQPSYYRPVNPLASFVMWFGGFVLFLLIILALIAGWSTFQTAAPIVVKVIVGLLLALATGAVLFLAVDKFLDIKHKHLIARNNERRNQERHTVQLNLLQTRIHADDRGNRPTIYDAAKGIVVNLPSGNYVQPVSQTYSPHTVYHNPKQPIVQVSEVPQEQAALPAPADIPTLGELLDSGDTRPGEPKSILGYTDGAARRGDWQALHSFFVVGLSGSGKSSTVAYYAALAVMHYARLLIIDPDAEEEQSISQRLAPLNFAMLAPVASTPAGAARVIALARKELERPSQYPILLIIDEFSTIMRQGKMGGPWQDIAQDVAGVAEEYAQRGRKRNRTCIAIGQIAKASRTGGTELRASMTATFIHRIPVQQARMVIDSDTAVDAPRLATGECMVLLNNAPEPYRMNIPYAAVEDMQTVRGLMVRPNSPVSEAFQRPFRIVSSDANESPVNDTRKDLKAATDRAERISELVRSGSGKGAIITEIWGLRPGGGRAYQEAAAEYDSIVAQMESEA